MHYPAILEHEGVTTPALAASRSVAYALAMERIADNKLIGSNGKPLFGIHEGPITDLNLRDFRFHGSPRVSKTKNDILRDFQLKRWQFMGVCAPEFIFGAAVVHMGYLSNIFAYTYDRRDGELVEFNSIQALAANTGFTGNLLKGQAFFRSSQDTLEIVNSSKTISLELQLKMGLCASLIFTHTQPSLSLVTRVGLRRFNYTNKEAGLPVSGEITMGGKRFRVHPDHPSGLVDYTYGYLARYTFWNWASGAGYGTKGQRLGFNLAQGVNETGYTENCFWIDDRLIKTDVVDFNYDDLDEKGEWRIRANDGAVDLIFKPEGSRSSHVNLGLISSQFQQPFGSFHGTLREGKKTYELDRTAGFVEEHESKW